MENRLNQVSSRILPVLSFIPRIFFILKNSSVLHDYKHTHNMMQPLLYLKIQRVVLCCICPKHTFVFRNKVIDLSHFLQYYFNALLQTGCCFGVFLFCTGSLVSTLYIRLVLWSNNSIVDPSSVFSYHSLQLCFNVTIGLVVKSLRCFLPLRQLS